MAVPRAGRATVLERVVALRRATVQRTHPGLPALRVSTTTSSATMKAL
jgi:hypothetical protein